MARHTDGPCIHRVWFGNTGVPRSLSTVHCHRSSQPLSLVPSSCAGHSWVPPHVTSCVGGVWGAVQSFAAFFRHQCALAFFDLESSGPGVTESGHTDCAHRSFIALLLENPRAQGSVGPVVPDTWCTGTIGIAMVSTTQRLRGPLKGASTCHIVCRRSVQRRCKAPQQFFRRLCIWHTGAVGLHMSSNALLQIITDIVSSFSPMAHIIRSRCVQEQQVVPNDCRGSCPVTPIAPTALFRHPCIHHSFSGIRGPWGQQGALWFQKLLYTDGVGLHMSHSCHSHRLVTGYSQRLSWHTDCSP